MQLSLRRGYGHGQRRREMRQHIGVVVLRPTHGYARFEVVGKYVQALYTVQSTIEVTIFSLEHVKLNSVRVRVCVCVYM